MAISIDGYTKIVVTVSIDVKKKKKPPPPFSSSKKMQTKHGTDTRGTHNSARQPQTACTWKLAHFRVSRLLRSHAKLRASMLADVHPGAQKNRSQNTKGNRQIGSNIFF